MNEFHPTIDISITTHLNKQTKFASNDGSKITDPRVCKDDRHLCTLCHKIFACEEMHRMMDLDDVKECWCYNCLDKYNFKY
jgi:hypothetical protein